MLGHAACLPLASADGRAAANLSTAEQSCMPERKAYRIFATCSVGDEAENLLRQRGYQLEVYPDPKAPPKSLIIEKLRSGIDGLITTLRDPIDEEVFAAGDGHLKVVAQIAVGFDNIDRAAANRHHIPFTHTPDVL